MAFNRVCRFADALDQVSAHLLMSKRGKKNAQKSLKKQKKA